MRDCALGKPSQGRPFALILFTVNSLPVKYTDKPHGHRENMQTLQLKGPTWESNSQPSVMPQLPLFTTGDSLVHVHIQPTSFSWSCPLGSALLLPPTRWCSAAHHWAVTLLLRARLCVVPTFSPPSIVDARLWHFSHSKHLDSGSKPNQTQTAAGANQAQTDDDKTIIFMETFGTTVIYTLVRHRPKNINSAAALAGARCRPALCVITLSCARRWAAPLFLQVTFYFLDFDSLLSFCFFCSINFHNNSKRKKNFFFSVIRLHTC